MRNHKGEMETGNQARDMSRGNKRKAPGGMNEESTFDKFSFQTENDKNGAGNEISPGMTGYGSEQNISPKRKSKISVPLGPDQLKKEIHKKLDSNMELIMKRISKEPTDNPDSKSKIKLFFNKSVYEVDTPNKGPKQNDTEMKKVYKELKESFNLLYSTDMNEQNNRLRKITGSNFYNDSFGQSEDNFRSVRGNNRFDQTGKSMRVKKAANSQKQNSQTDINVHPQLEFTKKPAQLKPEEILIGTQIPKSKATPKSVKHSIDTKNVVTTLSMIDNFPKTTTNKSSHKKAISNTDKKMERPMTMTNIKNYMPKTTERKLGVLVNEEPSSSKYRPTYPSKADDDQMNERHIPSIHRSFSNYYMRNFIRTNAKAAAEKKPFEMKETNMSDCDLSRRNKDSNLKKVVRSKSNKLNINSSTQPNSQTDSEMAPSNMIDSYYSLVLDLEASKDRPLSPWLKAFILDMIKTMQDFTNRFPHGAAPPDKSVNLPAKDKKSRFNS